MLGLVLLIGWLWYNSGPDPDAKAEMDWRKETAPKTEVEKKKEDALRTVRKRIAEAGVREELRKKIKNCMFENVEKVTNKITERIVHEECKERAISGSDWSSKLKEIIKEIKK